MPRKRATRTKNHAKPKKPEGDIGSHLDPEERKEKLKVFLRDFDVEVKERLQKIEAEKIRIQSIIEKEINIQLGYLPMEIRNMNIMDFVAAGGTVEAAQMKLQETAKDCNETDDETETLLAGSLANKKKKRELKKGKGAGGKTDMGPPSTAVTRKHRTRFQTPMTRQMPAVWDTPAITPKFDVNLPFTPGIARAPKHGERLMSLAGSPVDVSATHKVPRTLKHKRIQEEDEVESAVDRFASTMPHIPKADIHRILSDFAAAKNN